MRPSDTRTRQKKDKLQQARNARGKIWQDDLLDILCGIPNVWCRGWLTDYSGQPYDIEATIDGRSWGIECKHIVKGNLPFSAFRPNEVENLSRKEDAGGVAVVAVRRDVPASDVYFPWYYIRDRIRQARAELSGVMSDFSRTEEQIRNADDAQNELNSSIRGGSSAADTLLGRFKSLVATVGGLAAIKKVVGLSDELASTKARLNLIVDQQEPVPQLADASVHVGLDVDDSQLTDKLANTNARVGVTVDDGGSVEELERKIMASAQRSRAAYFDTASAVASMGANAKAAFSSNDELISFIEQVNKQFVIGGADAQGQAAAMLQLKQAMGMGVLRGEELNSVLENAPGIARIIEQYMGIAEGSIKSYAEKGAVTAEVVKDALLGAADETNAAFESMPMTWGQIWTSMQNKALSIFSPILQRINDIANTDKFSAVTDGLLDGLAAAAKAGTVTLDVLLSIASAFMHILQPTPPLPHAAQSPPAPSASRASSGRRKSPVGHMQSVQPAAPGCRPPWLCPASSARKRSVRRPLQAAGWPTPARPSPSRLEE